MPTPDKANEPIHQGVSESIESYYDRFTRREGSERCHSCSSQEVNDFSMIPYRWKRPLAQQKVVEAFIGGLRVPRQREFIFYADPSTLEAAFQAAVQFELCQSRNRRAFPKSLWGNLTDSPSTSSPYKLESMTSSSSVKFSSKSSSHCPVVIDEDCVEAESIYRSGEAEGSRDGLHRYLEGLSSRLVSVGAAESTLSDFGVLAAMLENDWVLSFQKAILEDGARRLESLVEKRSTYSDTDTVLKLKGGIKCGYAAPKTTHLCYRVPNPKWAAKIASKLPPQMSIWCESLAPGPLCKTACKEVAQQQQFPLQRLPTCHHIDQPLM
eukprot:Protomagalhaensia_wolfi_Nauph_80__803@NODE_1465_length_1515_cov_16_522358_g1133_i0_p1_GENE_NODE_1465_length_1515_cov_16_522358_g1133_i0NODE_1465_length_1515_cov_16_522358_g1133_i0_p1_ORF_typecomplete_len346_score46_07_NODE_1465_length_1515_cov_16_522358_g1133_i0681039